MKTQPDQVLRLEMELEILIAKIERGLQIHVTPNIAIASPRGFEHLSPP